MAQWAVVIPADRWATERLFHHDTLTVPDRTGDRPQVGDDVLVVAGGAEPAVVALARVDRAGDGDPALLTYTRRSFDEPVPADGLVLDGPVTLIGADQFRRIAVRVGAPPQRRTWLVSLDLPIEADTPAEAVRQFWTYVLELGPRELPAFVSPSGDELAMQAFVLGEQANQDPEEDEDDD
jgi:hypothetical protein